MDVNDRANRQLMRQRGAGNRNIDNVEFGFSFPTPDQLRRSSRTPQTVRRSIERHEKTPLSASARQIPIEPTQQVITRDLNELHTEAQEQYKTPNQNLERARSQSSKRRRLNSEVSVRKATQIAVDAPIISLPNMSTVYNRKSQENDPLRTGSDIEDKVRGNDGNHPEHQKQMNSPLFSPSNDKENANTHRNDAGILISSQKQGKSTSGMAKLDNDPILLTLTSPDDSMILSTRNTPKHRLSHQAQRTELSGSDTDSWVSPEPGTDLRTDPTTETSVKQSKKRKKRKSVILRPRKRPSLDNKHQNATPPAELIYPSENAPQELQESDEEFSEEEPSSDRRVEDEHPKSSSLPLWKQLIAGRVQQRQGRLSVPTSPAQPDQDDEEGDETYVDDRDEGFHEEYETPANKKKRMVRHGKARAKRNGQGTDLKHQNQAKRNTFPILTHRIANVEALPTIAEEGQDEELSDGDDPLPPALSTRAQPNAIDILAQCCRETVQSIVENLGKDTTTGRAEIKPKRAILESFSQALDQRLFEMSEAVEHRLNLEARLRKSKREKAELQTRWIEIRRQRDEIALKADDIRRQNWENEQVGNRRWEISELANNTGLELKRNEPANGEDLEFMLKRVGHVLSHDGGQAAILNRVTAFNSVLERIATTLER